MIRTLERIFGPNISVAAYGDSNGLPFFLSDNYTYNKAAWNSLEFVIMRPKNQAARLSQLKKHYQLFASQSALPCALSLDHLTSPQRENLLNSNIPFISSKGQIFLPFWGCAFMETLKDEPFIPVKMTPTTQLVFLYIVYKSRDGAAQIKSAEISSALNIPKSSTSRAMKELSSYGLIETRSENTTKWITLAEASMMKSMQFMQSPVGKTIYLKSIPDNVPFKVGGIKALAEISMISLNDRDGSIVFEKHDAQLIPEKLFINQRTFDDFGGVVAEIWKYDPSKLACNNLVDELSLLLCLKDTEDERVQNELDTIRMKYNLEVE